MGAKSGFDSIQLNSTPFLADLIKLDSKFQDLIAQNIKKN